MGSFDEPEIPSGVKFSASAGDLNALVTFQALGLVCCRVLKLHMVLPNTLRPQNKASA